MNCRKPSCVHPLADHYFLENDRRPDLMWRFCSICRPEGVDRTVPRWETLGCGVETTEDALKEMDHDTELNDDNLTYLPG